MVNHVFWFPTAIISRYSQVRTWAGVRKSIAKQHLFIVNSPRTLSDCNHFPWILVYYSKVSFYDCSNSSKCIAGTQAPKPELSMNIFIQSKTTRINIYAKPSCWTRHSNATVPKPKENNTPLTPGDLVCLIRSQEFITFLQEIVRWR